MALEAVGGALLSTLLQVAFEKLASKEVIDYFKRKKLDLNLLQKLKIAMLSINKLIDDAEVKETTNQSVKQWLDALKDAVYYAEDVLDVISTVDHTYKMKTKFHRLLSKLRPSWNPFDLTIDQELDNVFGKLQFLLEQKKVLGLKESNPSSSRFETSMRLPTTSLVEQSAVYGRDVDKECITKLLLSEDKSNDVGVIAIVGMGGLGKTTLAQLVFNDDEINQVFKLNKVWICVAQDFDVIKITKTFLEKLTSQSCETNDFDVLQMKLKETLSGKRFLLALDDVWNENYTNWDNLRRPFSSSATGSKIIVTTRSEKVASVMRATSTYKLKPLSDEACWLLFAKHAFENIQSDAYSTFEVLGRELVKKCQGLPLAATVLGGLLRTKLGYEEWKEVLKSDIWDLSNEASDNILPVLKLSYHCMPSNLKQCFAFCSIVPKDFDFDRKKLVLLWMAQNLLQDTKSKKRIDIGYEYLRDLESRSLIQPSTGNGELYFRMHDLINDLAKSVSGEVYKIFDHENSFSVGEKTRHFSYVMTFDNYNARFEGFHEAKHLRTFLPLLSRDEQRLSPLLRSQIWPQLKLLRSLTLTFAEIKILPDSIGNLKILRYLDLSYNSELNLLPKSLASLYNLEVLILRGCESLTKLPTKLKQLTKLNHLDIRDTRLQEMPLQMGRLKDLDVLTDFVVGKDNGSSITELKELDLRGELSIRGLENITHPEDALVVNLKEKSYLEELNFEWNNYHDKRNARIILENLRPHVSLKKLYISKYSGTRLPDWLGDYSFVNLVDVAVSSFKYCFDMSPLGQLPSLKYLFIRWCKSLVTLVGTEIPAELPNEVGHYSALVDLHIFDCRELELPQRHRFTSVEYFILNSDSGDSIQFFPLSLFPKVKSLHLRKSSFKSLAVTDEVNSINLEYLEALEIEYCLNFEFLDAGKWCAPKMTVLKLYGCESLKVLPENMCNIFPSLLELSLDRCLILEALPQSGLPISLRTLEINRCKKLMANRSSWGLQRLLSLSTLKISDYECDDLEKFPEEGLLPNSLSTLKIEDVPNLTNLNGKSFQLLTSLETLELLDCPKLQCLPEQGLPTSLSTLCIWNCPLLKSRCQREQGEDWSKIAHIPNISFLDPVLRSLIFRWLVFSFNSYIFRISLINSIQLILNRATNNAD